MKTLFIFTVLLLIFGCSNKDNSKIPNIKSLETNLADTIENNIDVMNENIQYIGFANNFYFSNENEAYIELYNIEDELTSDEYDKLVKLADSLIYEDGDNSRHRFPADLSHKYFDLRGLSKLKVYDDNNKFICNADFVRVEYLNQNISPCFIAVYKTEKKMKSDNYYCISNFNGTFEPENYSINNDTITTQKLLNKLNVSNPYNGLENNGIHIQFKNSDTTISVINSDNSVYIVLTSGEEFKVLYKSAEPENFYDLIVIPLIKNKLPYFLSRNIKPESDVMWDNLMYFDGKNYIHTKRQRIE